MQLTSRSIVLDYYPIQDYKSVIFPNKFLRILSFKGATMNKRLVDEDKMNEEVRDRVDNYNYKITGNNDNLPQFFTSEVLLWLH